MCNNHPHPYSNRSSLCACGITLFVFPRGKNTLRRLLIFIPFPAFLTLFFRKENGSNTFCRSVLEKLRPLLQIAPTGVYRGSWKKTNIVGFEHEPTTSHTSVRSHTRYIRSRLTRATTGVAPCKMRTLWCSIANGRVI